MCPRCEVPFNAAVEAAQHLMDDQELALLMFSAIRDLFPGTFGYRLRHAVLAPEGGPSI